MTATRPLPLVPDCGGPIRIIALALPAAFLAQSRPDDTVFPLVPIANLLSALPSELTTLIVIDHASFAPAQNWLDKLSARCRIQLLPLGPDGSVSHPWIQDMLHARMDDREATPSADIVLVGENAVGLRLADHLGAKITKPDVILAGGNQLVGPDFRLVGHSSLWDDRAVDRNAAAPSQRWRNIQALDSRTVRGFGYRPEDLGNVPISRDPAASRRGGPESTGGKMHQCGFHVDQFVSVTGLRRDGAPLLLVADPVAHGGCNARAATELKRKLDASAISLVRQGFAIERNPIPVSPAIDTGKCIPRLYNNVLLENVIRSGQKQPFVWIPHFGDTEALEEFDAMNRQIWNRLGFQAIGVAGWSHLVSRNGALRCATKVINRDADTLL
ncbi:hypothetical protein [Agrobacterium sp. NPDC089420]|uniref:hypothetical protein n=1 Tax=Agrobacterium sp. NPDC089420 TaxID=3363918 RepID=UPI00384D0561